MKKTGLFFLVCVLYFNGFSQRFKKQGRNLPDTVFLASLLNKYPAYFSDIISRKDSFNVQIIYTQIDRDKNNYPVFKEFHFNLNKQNYFYPASTVKMPVAFLALEKLNELNIRGLDKTTTMVIDSGFAGQSIVYTQPNAVDSRATIENYIKQIFLVSDNDAFNRLYEFVGQETIHHKLVEKGYPDIIIRHRLNISLSPEQNRATNPIKFYDTASRVIYEQKGQFSNAFFPVLNVQLGKGYYKGDTLVNAPFDFSLKNRVYLQDQHHILQSVLFPEAFKKSSRFNLKPADYAFVQHWMSAYPRESDFPNFDSSNYWDAYCKFLLRGGEKGAIPGNIRIFNKVGDAYGFLTDIAYIVDLEHHIEFLLSATISCNSDGIYNDDHYDYNTVGYPFMKHLGEVILKYELERYRKYPPNLTKFAIKY